MLSVCKNFLPLYLLTPTAAVCWCIFIWIDHVSLKQPLPTNHPSLFWGCDIPLYPQYLLQELEIHINRYASYDQRRCLFLRQYKAYNTVIPTSQLLTKRNFYLATTLQEMDVWLQIKLLFLACMQYLAAVFCESPYWEYVPVLGVTYHGSLEKNSNDLLLVTI